MNDKVELFDIEERQPNDKMPGGRTWIFDGADNMNIKFSEMWEPATSMHSHSEEQINLVLSGKVLFKVGDTEYMLTRGTAIRIPPNVPHGISKKLSKENFRVIQIISPSQSVTESLRISDSGHTGWPKLEQ